VELEHAFIGSLTFWMGMTSTSAVILCVPQKSSISWVSGMSPMLEPERLWRPMMRANAETPRGFVSVLNQAWYCSSVTFSIQSTGLPLSCS